MNANGFIKFQRSQNARELMKKPKCFVLLALVALRARRTNDLNVHGLKVGESLVGDYRVIGLTEREYRTAKATLEKFGLATFRGTSRGTVAELGDNSVFDINAQHGDGRRDDRVTTKRRARDGQETTNKNGKKKKNEKNGKKMGGYKDFKKKFIRKKTMTSPSAAEIQSCR